jgi:glyoxylase-like metal-dependent hydrolase (beta-lactamase superfamily II)
MSLRSAPLRWAVYVAPPKPAHTAHLAPGEPRRMWPPTSATLIDGERAAVLVGPLMTIAEVEALCGWLDEHGKHLTAIYATQGHGDQCFGAGMILDRHRGARLLAAPGVAARMRRQAAPESIASVWNMRFPGQIPDDLAIADALDGDVIELEGRELAAVPAGDNGRTTYLHVPSPGLVVAGAMVYNDVHPYLGESDRERRRQWIAALDGIDALRPRAVVAGHRRPGNADHPRSVGQARGYSRDFERVAEDCNTTLELYERMLALHPDRIHPGALWVSARMHKGEPPSH